MKESYWKRYTTRRLVLRAGLGAGIGLGALSLVGCGDDDDDPQPATGGTSQSSSPGPSGTQTSSRLAPKIDTSAQAQPGGIYPGWAEGDETNLDPLTNSRASRLSTGLGEPANSRIFREVPSVGSIPSEPTIAGDLAESWELADEGLKLTVKLRNDIKLDPREPTNGRQMTAEDVVFSLNKMFSLSPFGTELSNEREPTAPIVSVTAIDKTTVQYSLAFPWSPLFATLAHGRHVIQPVEAEDQYDPRTDVRGSGPWMLESYEPSVKFTYRRHPLWHRANEEGLPYIDGYDAPILSEAATRVSQLRAKNIWDLSNINNSDLVSLITDNPEINIHEGEQSAGYLSMHFGSQTGSPFFDSRVRQAFSMAIDRETFGLARSGADLLAKVGIDQLYAPASHISPFWGDLWLDPLSDQLGEGSKYFKYNPSEAKALLKAAGYEDGIEAVAQVSSRRHGNGEDSEIVTQMLSEIGVKTGIETVDYQTVFLPKMWVVAPGETIGDFDGFSFGASFGGAQHIATNIYTLQHSKGAITASRRWDDGQDKVDSLIEKMLTEFDQNRLTSLVHEFQMEQAKYMSGVPVSSPAMSYRAAWPWVRNYQVFYTSAGGSYDALGGRIPPYLYTWIDESKM